MEQICNNDNFSDVRYTSGLIDTTSNGKEFSFSSCDIYSVIRGFDDRFVVDMNMSNRDGNIVFDTSISNNKSIRVIWRGDNWDMRLFMLCLLEGWKEKKLGKMSIIWEPGENSLSNRSNTENTSLNLLFISITEPLIIFY